MQHKAAINAQLQKNILFCPGKLLTLSVTWLNTLHANTMRTILTRMVRLSIHRNNKKNYSQIFHDIWGMGKFDDKKR